MTDQHDHLDDLASAHLDGRTTPAEAARVEAEPALAARVARLAATRERLLAAATDPVDPVRRDQAIDAALAAFAELDPAVGGDGAGSASPVVPLTAARWRTPRRTLQLAGIAAAVVLLALAVPLLGRLGSGSHDDDVASVEESGAARGDAPATDAAEGSGPAADEATEYAGSDTTPLAAAALPDLGAFEQLSALGDSLRARLAPVPEVATGSSSAPTADAGCAAELDAEPAPIVLRALAVLDERPVLVVVREGAGGERTATVLDRSTCTTVATVAL